MNDGKIRYFSMFTGVGGFELGLEDKGECVGFSEIDKYCSELLSKRFPRITNFGDATKINPRELPDFDMLCGGFPCQAFSIAGKRRGFNDTRGTLFFEIARIIEVKRPKIIFLENVKGLLNHNKGETFSIIIQTLSELGYDVQWMVLNSKFFGVPQNRERVFIIGSLRGESKPEILPFRESNKSSGRISQLNNPRHSNDRIYAVDGISPTLNTAQGGNRQPNIITSTITTENAHVFGKNVTARQAFDIASLTGKIRRLTPLECERLQGFPDNWTEGFSDTQRYKMMGNAVTVNVIRTIGEKLLEASQEK
jgi:DNA (cytosine-5)-methyltransferase 1